MRFSTRAVLMLLAAAALTPALTISGTVVNVGATGDVYLALVEDLDFSGEPAASLILDCSTAVDGCLEFRLTGVDPGNYGLMVFQDMNSNGDLDRGLFGPTEPWGDYRRSRPVPHFDEIVFTLCGDLDDVVIELE